MMNNIKIFLKDRICNSGVFSNTGDWDKEKLKRKTDTFLIQNFDIVHHIFLHYFFVKYCTNYWAFQIRSDQSLSRVRLCDPMNLSTPGLPVHHQLPEFTRTQVHWVSDAMKPSHPLLSLLLPSIFPSIRVFSNESALHIRWPKYWSFSFSISPSNEYSGLISFRMDWLDLLAVQGTLKSLLQHHSSKASILHHSVFF